MTNKKITKILSVVFLVYAISFLVHESLKRPRVLILHSYYTDFSWVNEINVGIKRVLWDRPYNIRYHYMDTKRHPSLEFKLKAGATARKMIRRWRPDVILAFDDNAQEYVGKYFVDDPNISIFYAGVNADPAQYGYDKASNVSGICETMPWALAVDQIKELLGNNARLLHLSDDSPSSEAVHESAMKFNWVPYEFVGSKQIGNFNEWKAAVKHAENTVDCLLITHYHTIRDPNDPERVVKPAAVIKWTEANSNVPTLGFARFFVEDGGTLAVGLSPFEQGEAPARMAVKFIEKGITAKELKRQDNRLFTMYVRKSAFPKRFSEKMPLEIEAFAHAVDGCYE